MGEAVPCGIDMAGSDIVIPCGEGERTSHDVVIETVEKSHEVAGDELARLGVLMNDVDLILLIAHPGVGYETVPVEAESGVVVFAVLLGHWYLGPIVVSLAPIGSCPMLVELIERLVFRFEPAMEKMLGDVVIRHVGVAVFIVDLPSHNVGIVSETDCHFCSDLFAELTVAGRGDRSVSANSVRGTMTGIVDTERVRIFMREPRGRSGSRRAQN